MPRSLLVVLTALLCAASPARADEFVTFHVTVTKDGAPMSSPVVTASYSREAVIELGNEVPLELLARPPAASTSTVTARIFLIDDGELQLAHIFESPMDLTATPSFQYSSSDRRYRLETKPRLGATDDASTT